MVVGFRMGGAERAGRRSRRITRTSLHSIRRQDIKAKFNHLAVCMLEFRLTPSKQRPINTLKDIPIPMEPFHHVKVESRSRSVGPKARSIRP
eukprot:scaffold24853_cov176-Cylindrotheca_fusiformis.AAC.1